MADLPFYDIVKLNGKTWPTDEFKHFVQDQLIHQNPESWLRDLYRFYVEWFNPDDEIIVQTSGSTGPVKNIRFNKNQLLASARQTGSFFKLDKMNNCLLCVPVGFIAGKMMVVRALVYGLDLLAVKPGSDPLVNLQHPIDFAAMTPHQVFHSLNEGRDLSKVQTLIIGGGQVSPELLVKLQNQSTACFSTYGMAETLTHIAVKRLNGPDQNNHFNCLPGIKIKSDKRNCLVISANYLPEEIVTNDMVELLSDNEFKWLGRFDNVINSGGIKIFPEQIEEKISSLIPGNHFISSSLHPALGEKVILVIEGEEPSANEKSNLFENLRKILQRHECPKEISFVERFEFTSSGKINREKSKQGLVE
ncbi:MAG: AMP-binding protein [Bacteroidales bacterium]|nr:AMP-binding protein [Bacteroidales bacterium]MCF8457261.1 AMP-binding protein [Bacteroidales bacterium]